MQNTKGKFALKMEDGAEVRNIDDLKAHFDIGSVVRDFSNGKLLTWLEDRYYDEEADTIRKISTNEGSLEQKLCAIFGIESEWIIERRNRLKRYTNDANILANADKVAFDQEDLADLLDEGVREIYLCDNRFVIPLRMKNKTYIGVSEAVAIIRSKNPVDFGELGIKFKNITFDDDYQKIFDAMQDMTKTLSKRIAQPKPFRFIDQKPTSPPPTSLPRAEVTTTIINKHGIHATPSSMFVRKASSFISKIWIKARGRTVDGKSVLMVMSMGLTKGTEITIIAEGNDAQEAVTELKELVDSGFGLM